MIAINEYLVHYNGAIQVEAENEDEARRKAEERPSHDLVIDGYEVEDLSPDERRFQLKIVRAGHDRSNATYAMMTDRGALKLAHRAVNAIADSLVGRDNTPSFKYDLACLLLASLQGDSVNKDEVWDAVQEIDENVHEEGVDWVRNLWCFESDDEGGN